MAEIEFELQSLRPTDLALTVAAHGWYELAPWQWDPRAKTLSRAERLSGGRQADVQVVQIAPNRFKVRASGKGRLRRGDLELLRTRVSRWFSLEWDPADALAIARRIDPAIYRFIRRGGGRLLRSSTFFEDVIKTICTTNASWGYTVKMVAALTTKLGDGCWPLPAEIAEASEEFLRNELRVGYRAKPLRAAAQFFLRENLIDQHGAATFATIDRATLLRVPGIGPYAAAHILMLEHVFDEIPVDSGVTAYCADAHGLPADQIQAFFEPWGRHRFLGYKLGRIIRRNKGAT
jgi:3-methyladenine DNA glycosylase/8-oxoguanine DNA glycosylase